MVKFSCTPKSWENHWKNLWVNWPLIFFFCVKLVRMCVKEWLSLWKCPTVGKGIAWLQWYSNKSSLCYWCFIIPYFPRFHHHHTADVLFENQRIVAGRLRSKIKWKIAGLKVKSILLHWEILNGGPSQFRLSTGFL